MRGQASELRRHPAQEARRASCGAHQEAACSLRAAPEHVAGVVEHVAARDAHGTQRGGRGGRVHHL
eukprot:scaffold49456_cov45-Phaeocystis_antarctica.AAC.1